MPPPAVGGSGLARRQLSAARGPVRSRGSGGRAQFRDGGDLPTASFAGQHESFLNVRGMDELLEACRQCFASVFTDRAIVYRNENGFDHLKIGLSVGIMKRCARTSPPAAWSSLSIPSSGFRDVVLVTGVWGLGERIVQGKVDPDEFHVHKPTFRAGHRCVLRRSLGSKQRQLVYGAEHTPNATVYVDTPASEQERFCLTDAEVLKLTGYAIRIEDHYSRLAPARIGPWTSNGPRMVPTASSIIVQARPETVESRRSAADVRVIPAAGSGPVLLEGRAVGERAASGVVRVVAGTGDLAAFRPGDVLVAADDQPGLGTGDEEGRRHRHRSRRPHLPRRHRRARARHSRHRRRRAARPGR